MSIVSFIWLLFLSQVLLFHFSGVDMPGGTARILG